MADFVNRTDFDTRLGAERIRQFFDDDRDGTLNSDEESNLNEVLAEANDTTIAALLHKGWSQDGLNGLSRDRALRRAAYQIAVQLMGERRPEFVDGNGNTPYFDAGERGRKMLLSFARGEQRSRLEDQHGKNASIRGRVSASTPVTVFGRDASDPNDRMGDGKGF